MVNTKITYILGVLVLCGWAGTTNALVVGGPGNSNNCFPFGCPSGWPPVYQQVYNSSEFTGQENLEPMMSMIRGLEFIGIL